MHPPRLSSHFQARGNDCICCICYSCYCSSIIISRTYYFAKANRIITLLMQADKPRGYLLLHNISKRNNVGNIIRSACAFGLEKVFFVTGRPESKKVKILKEFNMFGNQGTYKQIQFQPYNSLQQCKEALNKQGIKICGVEIGQGSMPVQNHPFHGDTAFFLGNEGTGLIPVHKKICDYFIYIPQYTEKTASLNVSVAAGIIFHHFALWAGYSQAKVYGEKYQLQLEEQKKEQEEKEKEKGEKIEEKEAEKMEVKQPGELCGEVDFEQLGG